MATFGDLERALADLYPYRWAVGAVVIALIAAFLAFGWWRGWHLWAWSYRKPLGIILVPVLAITLWLGWSLGSPLFTNVTVDEEFPFAVNATVPEGMEREEVEEVLSGFSKVDTEVMETMPAPAAIDVSAALAADKMGDGEGPLVMPATQADAMVQGVLMAMVASDLDNAGMSDEAAGVSEEAVAMMEEAIEQSEMMAQPAAANQVEAVAMGSFKDADAFHRGSGTATIYRTPDGSEILRLENLDVTNGPALHVVLSTHPDPERSEQVKQEGYVDLGDLKGNRGNQNYPIPAGVDTSIHKSVVIYCYPFAVVFSVATLEG